MRGRSRSALPHWARRLRPDVSDPRRRAYKVACTAARCCSQQPPSLCRRQRLRNAPTNGALRSPHGARLPTHSGAHACRKRATECCATIRLNTPGPVRLMANIGAARSCAPGAGSSFFAHSGNSTPVLAGQASTALSAPTLRRASIGNCAKSELNIIAHSAWGTRGTCSMTGRRRRAYATATMAQRSGSCPLNSRQHNEIACRQSSPRTGWRA